MEQESWRKSNRRPCLMTDGEEVSRQRGRHVQKHRGVKREGPLGEVQ